MRPRNEKTSRSGPSGRIEKASRSRPSGNLRIGDHWNAITIIALSQSNPLKAVADQQRAEEERTSRDVLARCRRAQGGFARAARRRIRLVRPESRRRRAPAARARARRTIDTDLAFAWRIVEGEGTLDRADAHFVAFHAGSEPGLVRVEVVVTQRDVACRAEAQLTVTASLVDRTGRSDSAYQGLPGYTYQKAAGELWRSRFDAERNLVVINNGHRDFVYAARNRMLKLRYICRLFAKELVLRNFAGVAQDELLERLLELTLYTEEHLR
jgi:hypothetical protein